MADQMHHSSHSGGIAMEDKERQVMREHIVWLSMQLEQERKFNLETVAFLKQILNPEDLGHAVSNDVRKLAYQLLINNHHIERSQWQSNN